MIRSDRIDCPALQRRPQRFLIPFRAQWRRHHVLHALHARALRVRFIQQQVRHHGLHGNLHPAFLGRQRRRQRRLARKMHYVPGSAGVFEKRCESPGPLRFHRFRAARLMPFWPGLSLGQQFFLQPVHQFGILAVRRHNHTQPLRQLQRLVHLPIIHAKKILVRKENLERSRSVRHNFPQLLLRLADVLRHRHMKRIVARAPPLGF